MEASSHIMMMIIDGLYYLMIMALHWGPEYSAASACHASEHIQIIVYKHCFHGTGMFNVSREKGEVND